MCARKHKESNKFSKLQFDKKKHSVLLISFISSSKQPVVTRNELVNFINDKCTCLFVPREIETILEEEEEDYGFRGKHL